MFNRKGMYALCTGALRHSCCVRREQRSIKKRFHLTGFRVISMKNLCFQLVQPHPMGTGGGDERTGKIESDSQCVAVRQERKGWRWRQHHRVNTASPELSWDFCLSQWKMLSSPGLSVQFWPCFGRTVSVRYLALLIKQSSRRYSK